MTHKFTAKAAVLTLLALGACTDPAQLGTDSGPNNTQTGALIGGLIGAGIGALTSSDSAKGAIIGGAAGAVAGGVIGNNLDKQEAELRADLANDGITIQNTGDRLIVSLPQDITFESDSSTVRASLRSDLGKVADNLLRYPDSSVQIIGHTDSDGEASYNATLSRQRAGAVADVLQSNGVTFNRLQTSGMGEDQPLASNLTEEGKARNRRVEIIIIPRGS